MIEHGKSILKRRGWKKDALEGRGLLHPQARAGRVSFSGLSVALVINQSAGRFFRNEVLMAIVPLLEGEQIAVE